LLRLEFEFLLTLRRGADCSELFLVLSTFGLLPHYNPTSTFRASDARARNAISHFKIILRSRSWISPFSTYLANRIHCPKSGVALYFLHVRSLSPRPEERDSRR